jgi:hypothetical protein
MKQIQQPCQKNNVGLLKPIIFLLKLMPLFRDAMTYKKFVKDKYSLLVKEKKMFWPIFLAIKVRILFLF